MKSLLWAVHVVCGRACHRRRACRCSRARCCCGPCISPPRVSSVAVRVAPGPTVQSRNRKKIKLVKKRKRKNENTPKSLFRCVCRRYWRSKIVSTEAPAQAAGSGFVFPWAGPKPLVGRHEGPAGLGPNRLGPARLTALSRACTSLFTSKSFIQQPPHITLLVISLELGACIGNRFVQHPAGRVVLAGMIVFILRRMPLSRGFVGYMSLV